jgi:hypothetical protein
VFVLLIAATQGAHRVLLRSSSHYSRRWGGVGCHVACAGLAVMALGSVLEFWV